MGKRKENEPRVYIIPKNFLDSGYVFGGRFKQRNFIEAAALTAPVFGIFLYGWKVVGWDVGSTVAACIILCTGVFMAAVAGIGGDSLLEFLGRVQHFRKTKQISKYNPRVKLEYEPEYLKKTRQNLPREKLLELAKSLEGKILGDDGLPVSADITDERLVVYFRDVEGFVEKPKALKTRAELKAEARETRKLEKSAKSRTPHLSSHCRAVNAKRPANSSHWKHAPVLRKQNAAKTRSVCKMRPVSRRRWKKRRGRKTLWLAWNRP